MDKVALAYGKYSLNIEIVKIRKGGTTNTCFGEPSNSCSKSDISVSFLGVNDGTISSNQNANGETTSQGLCNAFSLRDRCFVYWNNYMPRMAYTTMHEIGHNLMKGDHEDSAWCNTVQYGENPSYTILCPNPVLFPPDNFNLYIFSPDNTQDIQMLLETEDCLQQLDYDQDAVCPVVNVLWDVPSTISRECGDGFIDIGFTVVNVAEPRFFGNPRLRISATSFNQDDIEFGEFYQGLNKTWDNFGDDWFLELDEDNFFSLQGDEEISFYGQINFDNMDISEITTLEFQWRDEAGITQSERIQFFNEEYLFQGNNITISDIMSELGFISVDEFSTSIESFQIIIDGQLNISSRLELNDNFHFSMKPGSSIILQPNSELTAMGNSFTACGGGKWQGFELNGNSILNLCQAFISDAVQGIQSLQDASIGLDKVLIKNCENGINISGGTQLSIFKGNMFSNNEIGVFTSNCVNYLNLATDDHNFKNIFTDNTFGIVLNNSSGNVSGNNFNGGITGLVVGNSDMTNIGGNEFGAMFRAIDIVNSDFVTLRWNDIGTASAFPNTGVRLNSSDNSLFYQNRVHAEKVGILGDLSHFTDFWAYNQIDMHSLPNTLSAAIEFNMSSNNRFGALDIVADNCTAGVKVNGGVENQVSRNEIEISTNGNRSAGVNLIGASSRTEVYGNIVNSSFGAANGISTNSSSANMFECNEVQASTNAMNIGVHSNGQSILTNNLKGGIDLRTESELGPQFINDNGTVTGHGNEFYGGSTRAIGLSDEGLENSRFRVDGGFPYLPNDPIPGVNEWFFPNADEQYNCGINPGIPIIFFNEGFICQYLSRLDQLKSSAPNVYFIRFQQLLSYYNSKSVTLVPQCIKNYIAQNKLCGIVELQEVLNQLNTSDSRSEEKASIATQIRDILGNDDSDDAAPSSERIDYDYLTELTSKNDKDDSTLIEDIKDDLENILCSDPMIVYWKESLLNYLSALTDEEYTEEFKSKVDQMSRECDIVYGGAVHWNRAIAARFSNIDYAELQKCNEPAEGRSALTGIKDLKVMPNPSNGQIKIYVPKNMIGGDISILNIAGNLQLSMRSVQESELNLSLKLNSGMYIVKLENDQNETMIKRIVIQ